VPDPVAAPLGANVIQAPPPFTSSPSPDSNLPLPLSVIFEPSFASAEAIPPEVNVGGLKLVNLTMSHRTVTSSALALETVNRGNRTPITKNHRLFIYAPFLLLR